MATGSKLIAHRTEHGTEARRVAKALEALQTVLPPPDGLMRVLAGFVRAPPGERGAGWQHDGFRGHIARQPIGHDGGRYHLEALQEFAKEPLRRSGAPVALDQDVEYFARVIDGPPQPTPFSIDHQTQFIEVPDVRTRTSRAPQASGVLRPESQRPETDRFVRDLNPAGKHHVGHVAQTQTKTVVEPHAPSDDPGRKAIAPVER